MPTSPCPGALLTLCLAATSCGPRPAATPPGHPPATTAARTPLPAAWWVETADEVNPKDVGNAFRFSTDGLTLVEPDGKVEHLATRLQAHTVAGSESTWELVAKFDSLARRR
jgi:hypothetical protein